MHPYDNGIVSPVAGLPRGVREALADPLGQALLAADRVDPRDVADLSRRMAAALSRRNAIPAQTEPGVQPGRIENHERGFSFGPHDGAIGKRSTARSTDDDATRPFVAPRCCQPRL